MNRKEQQSLNPARQLFRILSFVSIGGLIAFIVADRFIYIDLYIGGEPDIGRLILVFVPLLLCSGGAFAIFKISFDTLERQLREREAARQQYLQDLEHSYQSVMIALVAALESRDHQAQGHSRRVVAYAQAIAERLGLTPEEKRHLLFGGYLHDVGKIGMDDALLRKTSSLTEEEWTEMRRHPMLGLNILEGVDFLGGALEIILYHHERYDGRGYPQGLAGTDIPLLARVFAVADAFDAMTADRPYRKALPVEQARRTIREEAGRQFCPRCAEAFLSLGEDELDAIRREVEENSRRRGADRERSILTG